MSCLNDIDMDDYNNDMLLDLLDKITVDEINNDYVLATDSVKYTLYNPDLYLTGASVIIQFEVSDTRDSTVWLGMIGDRKPYRLYEIPDVILYKLTEINPQINIYSGQYGLDDFKAKLKFELLDRMSDKK